MSVFRGKFSKTGEMKYISHLDLVRLFHRVLRRSGINISYTQGFNPHPIISFATALSLGVESQGEYFDLKLTEKIPAKEFKERINRYMPEGIEVLAGKYIDPKEASLMSIVQYSDYEISVEFSGLEMDEDALNQFIHGFLNQESIMITRKKKKKRRQRYQEFKEVDVKPLIKSFTLEKKIEEKFIFDTLLVTGSKGNLKPDDLMGLLEKYLKNQIRDEEKEFSLEITSMEIFRRDLYHEVNGELKDLIDAAK